MVCALRCLGPGEGSWQSRVVDSPWPVLVQTNLSEIQIVIGPIDRLSIFCCSARLEKGKSYGHSGQQTITTTVLFMSGANASQLK